MTDPRKPDDTSGSSDITDKRSIERKRPHRRTIGKAANDDSVLESIGKAVSAPVRNAADEDADEKPDS
jgi:hypothetical protein